ncbi:hypothetical protein CTT31_19290 [Pseudoalteromonas maricaloris]|nr:hypothetical protein QT15_02160 [Pseudoalteromonas flavipulchra NCIMB 2033 = ATCC BAA-314]USE71241.1 hypothetical protein CTT31_19290 [Pseudoalteromonas flavipulchra]
MWWPKSIDHYTTFSKAVIKLYGFENFEIKSLILQKSASNYLKTQNLNASSNSTDFCIDKSVTTLSSLGEKFLIKQEL